MLKRLFFLTALIMIGSCSRQEEDMSLRNFLDKVIEDGVPGVSVAVVDKDGVITTYVAGLSDITAGTLVNEGHLFGIGSITKTFVAVVTLQLVEEGRLSLDQTAMEILGAGVVGKVPGADRATIAQLLNHTSGIPSWEDDPLWIKEGRGENLDVKRMWKRQDTLPYIERSSVTNEPGEKFSYSNTNHTLIGLIIEKITGNDVVEEIRTRVLNPIGISDIYLEGFQKIPVDRISKRYHYSTPEFKRDAGIEKSFEQVTSNLIDVSRSNLSVEWTAGGMVSTARDLALYASAFRTGKLLKPESMAFVQKWFPINETVGGGHGLFHRELAGGYSLIGHAGDVLGSTGAMYWLEKEGIVLVVLSNVGTMHVGQKLSNSISLALNPNFIKQILK